MYKVGYPLVMSEESSTEYPSLLQAMHATASGACHPHKSPFVKKKHDKSCTRDGCVQDRVTVDKHRKNQRDAQLGCKNWQNGHCQCTRTLR